MPILGLTAHATHSLSPQILLAGITGWIKRLLQERVVPLPWALLRVARLLDPLTLSECIWRRETVVTMFVLTTTQISATAVPEPGSESLAGLALVGFVLRQEAAVEMRRLLLLHALMHLSQALGLGLQLEPHERAA
jgi:hypothetical protein